MKKRTTVFCLFATLAISITTVSCIFSSDEDDCSCIEITYGYDEFGFRFTSSEQKITCTNELKSMSQSGGSASNFEYDGFGRLIKEQTIRCN